MLCVRLIWGACSCAAFVGLPPHTAAVPLWSTVHALKVGGCSYRGTRCSFLIFCPVTWAPAAGQSSRCNAVSQSTTQCPQHTLPVQSCFPTARVLAEVCTYVCTAWL